MYSKDKYQPGDEVRVVRSYMQHLINTRAEVIEARTWRTVFDDKRQSYQIFAYKIRACDGKEYAAEEHCLQPWGDSTTRWVDTQRREKISVDEFARTTGFRPKAEIVVTPRAQRRSST